jgi:hypothetical protein
MYPFKKELSYLQILLEHLVVKNITPFSIMAEGPDMDRKFIIIALVTAAYSKNLEIKII